MEIKGEKGDVLKTGYFEKQWIYQESFFILFFWCVHKTALSSTVYRT